MNTLNETGSSARPLPLPDARGRDRRAGIRHGSAPQHQRILAERADWERFDRIAWTPWGTIIAAEEVITAAVRDRSCHRPAPVSSRTSTP